MQTGRQGVENIAKFLKGQEGFNCKKGLVFVLWSIAWKHVIKKKFPLSVYIARKDWECF